MTLFCFTCKKSMEVTDAEIVYDNGSDMAVYQCRTCNTKYLAVADDRFPAPILFKLTLTKSRILDKEKSRIIKPSAAGLIVSPAQAAAEAKRK